MELCRVTVVTVIPALVLFCGFSVNAVFKPKVTVVIVLYKTLYRVNFIKNAL